MALPFQQHKCSSRQVRHSLAVDQKLSLYGEVHKQLSEIMLEIQSRYYHP